jgi:transposase
MPTLKYEIKLTEEQRMILTNIVKTGKHPAKQVLRSNILLLTDDNRENQLTIREVADILHVSTTTVQNVRASYAEKGIESTIKRKKRETPPVERKITGDIEARIIALCCTEPPAGYSKWTLRLLTDKVIELGIIDSISYGSVHGVLKKRT